MIWPKQPLSKVAPPEPSSIRFAGDEQVWHLTLDQIESHTGRIVNKRFGPACEAGNSTYVFDKGNVLYSKLRPYLNKVVRPREAGIATTELVPLRPSIDVLLPTYLTYYLRSPSFLEFASSCVVGAKMPRVIMTKFWEHAVPLAPLSEQRRIIEILDQADALRKLRAEADAEAERILPALFNTMFGDLATNPWGWPTLELRELFAGRPNYGTMRPPSANEGEWLDLRVANIQGGRLDVSDKKYVNLSGKDVERHGLRDGDLVLARAIGSEHHLGKCVVVYPRDERWAFDSHLMRIRFDAERVNPEYISAFLSSNAGRREFLSRTRKSAVQFNINTKEFGLIKLPLPPLAAQKSFAAFTKYIRNLESQRARLASEIERLFMALTYQAFSGKLTASWREAHMTELLQEMEQQARALSSQPLLETSL